MKLINEMTDEELVKYYTSRRMDGVPTKELIDGMYANKLPDEQRCMVVEELKKIDRMCRKGEKSKEKKANRISGLMKMIGGILLFIFGCIFYNLTTEAGIIYVFNYVVWAIAVFLIIVGIAQLIRGLDHGKAEDYFADEF